MKKQNWIILFILAGSVPLQLNTLCFRADAAPGDVDLSFDAGSAVDDSVRALALQPDGKVLFLRWFILPAGPAGIGRLNANGTVDGSFNMIPGNWNMLSLALQPDGKIVTAPFLTGYNVDGSTNTGFQTSFGVPQNQNCGGEPQYQCYTVSYVTAVAAQPDGKLLAGVQSTFYYGCDQDGCGGQVNSYYVARFNADGSRDTNFAGAGPVGHVTAIAVQPDGKIFIGCDGFTTNRIIRLHAGGGVDTAFNQSIAPDASVKLVAAQADGKVLIAGGFTAANGTNFYRIARLNANGSLDTSFDPGTVLYFNDYAYADLNAMAVQPDGKVLIGGLFTAVNGTNRNNIARLNADGSLDLSFSSDTGPNSTVTSMALQPDGKVLLAGHFTTVNGAARSYLARLFGDVISPSLHLTLTNGIAALAWPVSALNFQLQESTNFELPNTWSPVVQAAVTNGGQISVTVPASGTQKFFRLKAP